MFHSKQMRSVIENIAHIHGKDLEKVGTHLKIEKGAGFDPLVVEVIGTNFVSVAHYFEQNGDLMSDPEMVFYTGVMDGYGWIPVSITQSPMGVYRECTNFLNGEIASFQPALQKELASFANMWAKNIKGDVFMKTKQELVRVIEDLRQPMNNISLTAQSIELRLEYLNVPDGSIIRLVEMLRENIKRLDDELLDFYRGYE